MESPADYPQPEGPADPSAKQSAVRTLDKNSGQKDNDGSQDNPLNRTPTEKNTTVPYIAGVPPVEGDKADSLQNGDKNSGQQANNGSQDNPSNMEKSPGDHRSPSGPTDVNTETPTGKNTAVPSVADLPPVEGGAGSDEGQSLPAVDNISGHKANDGNQDNPSNSEKSTGDHQSPSGPTDVNTGTPTEKKTTVPSIADVPPVEGGAGSDEGQSLPAVDNISGQQANDGSQDNPSNSEKSPGDRRSPSGPTDNNTGTPTEKKTTVPYIADVPPVEGADSLQNGDKNSGQQANNGSQDNPSNSEKSPGDPQSPSGPTDLSSTSAVSQKEPPNEEIEKQKMSKKEEVELIGPTATQTVLEEKTGILGGGVKPLVIVVLVALVAIVGQYYLRSKSPPQKTDWQQVDVFLKQMKKVKARFPNQRDELWSRSEIHLKRHLQTSQPTEPVSLILTSGVRAERTMRCLAQGVASAFSTARNASVLHIDGAGKAGQDSDQVKLDIDRKLQGAFEGDKPVAVIHRLEELPPGSTLIFYRYCDHENAAYKKTFLIFTVLLGDEEEIPAEMRLSVVEEMVDDYLQKRFLSHDHPVSFDRMDLNKYGGLWSRISHLILPVAAEDRIEQEGC
ncbi:torsin-1A-interacting protein 2-like isoform X1 [Poecilia latipinna]|uniref:torsin-1A-interacting protein 2-like isoform X1 n=1 Tax=Poecilia latipinna TaxID=48699 RepID=UPI00072E119F|nr:PREDICTED: torsin-1A-interacting protein 2-like isoform X1 [Poecilia latipinna]